MKDCPRCQKSISDSAVRCRYCRKRLQKEESRKPFFPEGSFFSSIQKNLCQEQKPAWGLLEVVFFFTVFIAGAHFLRQEGVTQGWVDFLRQNFAVFTLEPLLQVYVFIFCENVVLKLGLVLMIMAYLSFQHIPVFQSLALCKSVRKPSVFFNASFVILSLVVAWMSGLDPLAPDLPTPLFFQDAARIGNTLTIFSMVVVAPVAEEIFFRGFIYPALYPAARRLGAIFITSVLFAVVHGPQHQWSLEPLATIFVVGLFLSWARAASGSTFYTIGLHAFYNLTIVAAGFARYILNGY